MTLPIEPLLPEIVAALRDHGRLVLQAPPGAGKTTRVPLALLQAGLGGTILVLQPRRIAARMAAKRMAATLGEGVGQTVGYRVRLDAKVGRETRIELATHGIFLRRIQDDPALDGVACVIFDEFHERSLDSDLALALVLEARAALVPELKVLVMSATLDAGPVAALLDDAPLVTSEGRAFPVETRYLGRPADGRIEPAMARAIQGALAREDGSILAFLPGAAEIRRTKALLEEAGLAPGVDLAVLHGELDGASQDAAIAPAPVGRRKVVLASAIAETSITIEGVRVVVDSGLARVPAFDPASGMTRLVTVPASRATAEQRRGRAGRLGPGLALRLWDEAEDRGRPSQPVPEIRAADLAPFALELALWGTDGRDLALLDPPPDAAFLQARTLLHELGALGADGRATAHGAALARLGLHPRLAHMILAAPPAQRMLACEVAALLTGRDLLRGTERDADLRGRLAALRGEAWGPRAERGPLMEARQLARSFAQSVRARPDARADEDQAGEVVALAYPDRVAQGRGNGQFRMAEGGAAGLAPGDALAAAPFLAIAHLGGSSQGQRIHLAAPIGRDAIARLFGERIVRDARIVFDPAAQAVAASEQRTLGALVLEDRPMARPDAAAVAAVLADAVRRAGLHVLPWTEGARRLRARIGFLHRLWPDAWPDLSDAALERDLDWLLPYLDGLSRFSHLARLDMAQVLRDRLDHQALRQLDRLAPEALTTPTGRQALIDYTGDAPVLAAKLQEMFGQRETPRVADGQVAVIVHLLSPAGRPLQVTRDLAGFWRTGYAAVRAEMRGRYPRHPWPEDPLSATPTRATKARSG
ncbi:ATP-dependent helicase HrpB [Zavarzinia sp. CC-PAN008]|uniref:ATP-dependent helicase HrpB n=1 Tax=Zavarzinia sp. CC-PAN008 TaxID=3243332 RepID=UPI003F74ACAF